MGMHPMHFRWLTGCMLALAASGCVLAPSERERRRFDCRGLHAHPPVKGELDMNGRWTDRLSASVAEDGSWVRFYLTDPSAPLETITKLDVDGDGELDFVAARPGPAPQRYPFVYLAYIEVQTGNVVRSGQAHSTKAEREAGWFTSTPELATEQVLRGHEVRWLSCK
jgi:hypothetical protein